MEIKILKEEKNEIEFELESLTLAEVLRYYLNRNQAVTFAAWKREHATMNPVVLVKTSGKDAKSIVRETINTILKDLDSLAADFKNLK